MRRNSCTTNFRLWMRLAATIALSAIVTSCKTPLRPRAEPAKFTFQAEAGTGHVAVMSVAPWDTYVSTLQPNFAMTGKDAYDLAGAATAASERKLLDMLKVVARVATPTSESTLSRSTGTKTSVDADGKVTTTSERGRDTTYNEGPGELPEFTPILPDGRSASGLPGIESMLGRKPEITTGAHTRHLLATAIYQEVHLLNTYIRHAAIRDGYRASVTRLQVSLMPSVRNASLDAYTTIGFFPGGDPRLPTGDPRTRAYPSASPGRSKNLPLVVPLLVTDDMEAAMASDATDVVRQYALALSAMIQGFAVRADSERYTDELVATVTRDYNSLYQVARLSDNSIRVRMGARFHSSGHYFMTPQTHNVTLLVLTPQEWPSRSEVFVEARTEFRDVETGLALAPRDRDAAIPEYRTLLGLFAREHVGDDDIGRLRRALSANDFPTFRECLGKLPRRTGSDTGCCDDDGNVSSQYDEQAARRLWIAFAGVAVGGQYASTSFTLPEECACGLPESAVVTALDDGASTFTVRIGQVESIDPARLAVTLRLQSPDDKELLRIPATKVEFVAARQVLQCEFPGLRRIRHSAGDGAALLTLKASPWSAWLDIADTNSACHACACGPAKPRKYELSVVTVGKDPTPETPPVELKAVPAIRVCTCTENPTVTVRVIRKVDSDVAAVLHLSFLANDGKSPVSGRVVGALPAVDEVLNTVKVAVSKGAPHEDVKIVLRDLAAGTRIDIVAEANKVKSAPIQVLVFAPSDCPCKGDAKPEPAKPPTASPTEASR